MKYLFIFLLLIVTASSAVQCQNYETDSLNRLLKNAPPDTNRVQLLIEVAYQYFFTNVDSGLVAIKQGLSLARKLQYKKGEANALNAYGYWFDFKGDYPGALKTQFEALRINREMNDLSGIATTFGEIGIVYIWLGEYRLALNYLMQADEIGQHITVKWNRGFELANIGEAYDSLKISDSALYYERKAYEQFPKVTRLHTKTFILRHMGSLYAELGKNDSALKFQNDAILVCLLSKDKLNMSTSQKQIADIYESMHQQDSSFYYARMAFANAKSIRGKLQILQASTLLAKLHRQANNTDSVIFYQDISAAMRDSLYGPEKFRQLQVLMLEQQQEEETTRQQEERFRNKIKYASLIAALAVFLVIAFLLLRNNRHKQKANILLSEQKTKVESALTELKSAQAQLIQREKMASLGEVTAGIAHEIQNPLNFVNNFSEVNKELIEEMNTELDKGDINEAKAISNNIKQNLEKINHHGKRADAIVKGMLQHSRSGIGAKEFSDMNVLADEYLRLSYHGIKAKDKDFNATIKTDFDPSIGKINVVPQDIGRVLLNLYNNAFYATSARSKVEAAGFEPYVSVSTKKINDKIEIKVTDNGSGIPQNIFDKIFQPFFTTKPTGEGTGLGLSLSYDIIKAHGGEIKVETEENQGTIFKIQLPVA